MCDSLQAREKLSQCQTAGNCHGLWKISESVLNELTTDQSSGNSTIAPHTSAKPCVRPPNTWPVFVRVIERTPSVDDPLAAGQPEREHGQDHVQREQRHADRGGVPEPPVRERV